MQGIEGGIEVRHAIKIDVDGAQAAQQADKPPPIEFVNSDIGVVLPGEATHEAGDGRVARLEFLPLLAWLERLPDKDGAVCLAVERVEMPRRMLQGEGELSFLYHTTCQSWRTCFSPVDTIKSSCLYQCR